MTIVHVRLARGDGATFFGSLTMTPTRRHELGTTLVTTAAYNVALNGTALTDIDMAPTASDWCWTIQENVPGGAIRTVAVPGSGPVEYEALVDVDPKTLSPAALPEAAWWAALDAVTATSAAPQMGTFYATTVVADGATDNFTALTAIITAVKAAGGGVVQLPRGQINFGTTLDLSGISMPITFIGHASYTDAAGGTALMYTATGSGSGIIGGSSRGITFRGVSIQANNAGHTGVLVNLDKASVPLGDTCHWKITDGRMRGVTSTAALFSLDGSHDIEIDRNNYSVAQVGIKGTGTTYGYANNVRIGGNFEAGFVVANIKNAGQSWDVWATSEPLTSGAAGFYTHDSGKRGQGVTLGGWWGDANPAVAGSWVKWSGDGLTIRGHVESATLTTVLTLDENACHGISINADLTTPGGTGAGILATGVTTGHTGFRHVGGSVGSFTTPYATLPGGSFTDLGTGSTTIDSPTFTGPVAASSLAVAAAASAGAMTVGVSAPNLLSALQADFESAGSSGWSASTNCASTNTSTTKALHGTRSMAMVSTGTGGGAATVASIAATPGFTYSAMIWASSSGSSRSFRIDIKFADAGSATLATIVGSTAVNSGTGWAQSTASAVAPLGTATILLVARFDTTNAGGAGETYYFDQASVVKGPVATWQLPGAGSPQLLQDGQSIAQLTSNFRTKIASNGTGAVELNTDNGDGSGGLSVGDGVGGSFLSATSAGLAGVGGATLPLTGSAVSPLDAAAYRQMTMAAQLRPTALQYETFPRGAAPTVSNAGTVIATGILNLDAIWLPKGVVVSTLNYLTGATAATSPTHWWFALYNSSRVQLAITADQTTAAMAAASAPSLAVATVASGAASSFTTTYAGLHYIGIMVAATTPPTLIGAVVSATLVGQVPILGGTSDSAQTTPPAFAHTANAITAVSAMHYAGVG